MTAQYGPYVFDVADGPADADLLITGNISNSGGSYGITKVNSGKLILTGSNSYTIATVSGGTLVVANRDAIRDGTDLTVGHSASFPSPAVADSAGPYDLAVAPVPEPGTLALLAAGLVAAALAGFGRSLRRCRSRPFSPSV